MQPVLPHGGRRPGAGAPRGNLNAFKTGRYSGQFKLALEALLTNEETGSLLRAILEKTATASASTSRPSSSPPPNSSTTPNSRTPFDASLKTSSTSRSTTPTTRSTRRKNS